MTSSVDSMALSYNARLNFPPDVDVVEDSGPSHGVLMDGMLPTSKRRKLAGDT